MSKTAFALFPLILLLTCCATERWVQTGKTDEEAQEALRGCRGTTFPKPHGFSEPVYLLSPAQALENCMASKGYWLAGDDRDTRQVERGGSAPPQSQSFRP